MLTPDKKSIVVAPEVSIPMDDLRCIDDILEVIAGDETLCEQFATTIFLTNDAKYATAAFNDVLARIENWMGNVRKAAATNTKFDSAN